MRRFVVWAVLLASVMALQSADARSPMTGTAASVATPALQRLSSDVVPAGYDLQLTVDPREGRFSGEARIAVTLAKPTSEIVINGRDLRVTSVSLAPDKGAAIGATYAEDPANPGWSRVKLNATAPAGKATLAIAYDAPFASAHAGLYSDPFYAYAFTQLEPFDARRVYPSFDEPRFKAPYTVAITTRAGDVAVTNGKQLRSDMLKDGRVKHVFAKTEPLPTYLTAFAVGQYDIVEAAPLPKTKIRAREVPLRGIALKGKGKYFETALNATRGFIEWFEEYFATPYPYAKLDLIAVPRMPGAMENAGAIVYGERFILMPPRASADTVRAYAEIHAHELAHQWVGDLVTPMWWDDLWLNESFATWLSYRAVNAVMPEVQTDLRSVTQVSLAMDARRNATAIRRPIESETDIEGAFDFVTYYKGAAILGMMEDYLGSDRLRDGLRAYLRRHPHGSAASKDLFAALEESTGDKQIGAAFESFLSQNHAPLVTGALACKTPPRHSVAQATYSPLGLSLPQRRWSVPVCAKPYGASGAGARSCRMLSEAEASGDLPEPCPQFVGLSAGDGYFHQAFDADGWKQLSATLSRLPANEQLVGVSGARSAFAAKALEPGALLDLLDQASKSNDPALLLQVVEQAQALETTAGGAIDAYRAWVRATLVNALALAQNGNTALARPVLRALAIEGRDPAVRAQLAASAKPLIGLATESVNVENADLALRVAIEDGDATTFAALLAQTRKMADLQFRFYALVALGHSPRPKERAQFAQVLTEFSDLRGFVLYELAGDPATAPFAWDYVKANFEAIAVRERLILRLVGLFGRGLCSKAASADVADYVARNQAKLLPGYQAATAQALDAIDHCAALKGAHGPALASALKTRPKVVAARKLESVRAKGADALLSLFSERASEPPAFGEVVATCGRKFVQESPLAMCASTPAPRACSDFRLMVEQCMSGAQSFGPAR